MITSAGTVYTLAGAAGISGVVLGALPGSLGATYGVCVSNDTLFTTSENSILMIK
jgi:hypothetical protein